MVLVVKQLSKLNSIIPLPTKKSFSALFLIFMFDPHRTRRLYNRKYQKRGQIIQAKKVEIPRTIDQQLIPLYQDYFKKNYIEGFVPSQNFTMPPFYIDTLDKSLHTYNGQYSIPAQSSVVFVIPDDQNLNIYCLDNKTSQSLSIEVNGYYLFPDRDDIPFLNAKGQLIFALYQNDITSGAELQYPTISIPNTPGILLNEIQSS